MYPELFKIGPISIRGYGLMLTISFLLGVYYVYRAARKNNVPFEPLMTIAYIMIFSGVIGARLFYVLFHLEEFQGRWLDTINPFQSGQVGIAGLNLYGGIVLAVICTFLYIRAKKLPLLQTLDLFAPTVGIGLMFTRVGCFLNGCCFGVPTELPWGVAFPPESIPYYIFGDAHLHPTQIYSSLYGLLLFLVLHWRLQHKRFDGQVLALFFMIEAVFRFFIEYVRYYESEMHFTIDGIQPTYNQLIALALFLAGLILYSKLSRQSPAKGTPPRK